MSTILVYGDSVSWGIIPNTRDRLPFERRWPGILERALSAKALKVRVVEDCLNGRRTAWDDPYKPGRKALATVAQAMEMHSPIAVMLLMLGTNDFQPMHANDAWHSAQGVAAVIGAIRQAPIEPRMPQPHLVVIAPPQIREAKGPIAPKFAGAGPKCVGLSAAYRDVATALGCTFFDSNEVVSASRVDGIHLDADQHAVLGTALADVVVPLLAAA